MTDSVSPFPSLTATSCPFRSKLHKFIDAMGAGKGWDTIESLRAYKAFLIASEDLMKGTSQKAKMFALKIEDAFVALLLEDKTGEGLSDQHRSGSSIFHRYKRIKKECPEFEKCYKRVVGAELTSFPSHDDILIVVTALFNNFPPELCIICTLLLRQTLPVEGNSFNFRISLASRRQPSYGKLFVQLYRSQRK